MGNKYYILLGATFVCVCLVLTMGSLNVQADIASSSSYRLDGSLNNNFGGQLSSSNYRLVDSGGESIIGDGSGGSYLLGEGYTSQLSSSIQLTTQLAADLGTINSGTSNSAPLSLSILTDAPGYTLSISQNHDLQNGVNTIPAIPGSIYQPASWNEGTTKGLGFTLTNTNATAIPAKWSFGSAYAALPVADTSFYTRSGSNGGATDTLSVALRADISVTQAPGSYTNILTWTGTTTP